MTDRSEYKFNIGRLACSAAVSITIRGVGSNLAPDITCGIWSNVNSLMLLSAKRSGMDEYGGLYRITGINEGVGIHETIHTIYEICAVASAERPANRFASVQGLEGF